MQELIVRRNPAASDQSPGDGGEGRGTDLCCFRHRFSGPYLVAFVQVRNASEKDVRERLSRRRFRETPLSGAAVSRQSCRSAYRVDVAVNRSPCYRPIENV